MKSFLVLLIDEEKEKLETEFLLPIFYPVLVSDQEGRKVAFMMKLLPLVSVFRH